MKKQRITDKPYLNLQDAAYYFCIHPNTLRKILQANPQLPYKIVDRRYIIEVAGVEEWIKNSDTSYKQ